MFYLLAADTLLIVHFLFIGFVVLGSFVIIINLIIYGLLILRSVRKKR